MENAVKEAFSRRPHLVDNVRGFLGMETFTERGESANFYLVTRWTDEPSFHSWHSSEAHHLSHKGIPKGLKLEPGFTKILLLDRLSDGSVSPENLTLDAGSLLTKYLGLTRTVHLVAATRDGTIRFWNKVLTVLLGADPQLVAEPSLWGFLTESDAALVRKRMETGERSPAEQLLLNFVSADRMVHTLECYLDVQPDGFMIIGELPVRQNQSLNQELLRLNNDLSTLTRENVRKSRDLERALSELKSAQTMLVHQEKMASLGRMTAGVAHEINNPVAFVTNNHATLGRDFQELLDFARLAVASLGDLAARSPEVYERLTRKCEALDLDHLARAVPRKLADNLEGLERVKRIVLDLRNFSRLDEGDMKLCDVAEGVASTLRFLAPLLQERNVRLETEFEAIPRLFCSPGQLNQAISNVVTNAIQASHPGQSVKISTVSQGDRCLIQVTDRGVGIAAENLSRVFEPFFTTKPVGEGTGLGLSIAHQVVTAHHGELKISSLPGRGTTVSIEIPFQPIAEQGTHGT